MFIFSFGLLSMLTPPVAVASMVAAQLAGADMWKTGLIGLQLAAAAFLMPFLWVFNPALLLDGTWQEITLVATTAIVAGMLIGRMSMVMAGGALNVLAGFALLAVAIVVGSATIWIGPADPLSLVPAAVALVAMYGFRYWALTLGSRIAGSLAETATALPASPVHAATYRVFPIYIPLPHARPIMAG